MEGEKLAEGSQTVRGFDEDSALKQEPLSFWDGVAIKLGASIGSGILALPFGSRLGGFPALVFWVILTGTFVAITMLYVAETSMRTRKPLQLSGLARTYVGSLGSWLMFAAVMINGLGALTAYMTGSGDVIGAALGIPDFIGSLIFFVPAAGVVWLGLRVTGVSEKLITFGMVLLLLVLIVSTFIGPGIRWENLAYVSVLNGIPIFSLVLFSFISQYTVPAIARGFAQSGNIRRLPACIVLSQVILGSLFILVVASALGISGPEGISQVATLSWGQALGPWAFVAGSIFTLLAFITSFWAIGETALTNVVDQLKFPSEWDKRYRLVALSIVTIPPFLVAYSGLVGFVEAISFAGAFAGVLMAVIPIMMVNRARRYGDREPEWTCGKLAHPVIQGAILIVFISAALYSVVTLVS